MTEDVSIRRLGADDLNAYKRLRDEMLERHPEAFTSDAQTEARRSADDYLPRLGLQRPGDGHLTLGAWSGSELLGAIGIERDLRPKVRHIGHVVGMMVRGEIQGRGIGRALLDAAIDSSRAADIELLMLTVTDDNAAALRLYEAAGFTSFGTLPHALKIGVRYHDKVHMAKPL